MRANVNEPPDKCIVRCHLEADVVAATYGAHDPPRELKCEREHPHKGAPHLCEGWAWENGRIWKVEDEAVRLTRG